MATFLELAKDVARESGTLSADHITSVTNLTGRPDKVLNWVRKAWNNIQNMREDWLWMRGEFQNNLIPGTPVYTPLSFNLERHARWIGDSGWFRSMSLYSLADGQDHEGPITQVSYEEWYHYHNRGDAPEQGAPSVWAISPAGELCFGPTPDVVYVVRGMYQKSPQTLTAAADIPEMPVRFHDMIVWEAQRLMMIADGAYNEAQAPLMEFIRMKSELEISQLPEVTLG